MHVGAALFITFLVGLIIGVATTAVTMVMDRRRQNLAELLEPRLNDSVIEVLKALPQMAIVTDRSYNVVWASPGATVKGLVSRDNRLTPRLQAVAQVAWSADDHSETQLMLPRGPYGNAAITVRIRANQLSPRYLILLAEDLTEAIRVQEVRRDFVANVSHELKTPIGAVTLLAEAIGEASDDQEQVEYFANRLLIEGDRLTRLVREIIDLSRLQSTDAMAEAEDVNIADVVSSAVDQTVTIAEGKSATVSVRVDPDLVVWGDPRLLVMCMQNLITNAISYSPAGSRVGVGARRQGDVVEISVTDQGIGISEDDQKRIFERFYRVDSARSRNTGGTGLGLSIVRHVVENHGGDIAVWSQLGKGSTFTVRLPLIEAFKPGSDSAEAPKINPIPLSVPEQ